MCNRHRRAERSQDQADLLFVAPQRFQIYGLEEEEHPFAKSPRKQGERHK
jgi:hypothetical protein